MDILGEVFDAKKNLFEYIVNRHGLSGWAKYWTSYRDFIGGYTLKYEFERVIDEIFEASMGKWISCDLECSSDFHSFLIFFFFSLHSCMLCSSPSRAICLTAAESFFSKRTQFYC